MGKNTSILVSGGAGYIGSHVVYQLLEAGYQVVVVDDLSTGHRHLLPAGIPFIEGSVGDVSLMIDVLKSHACRAVMHFAGAIVVPESVTNPIRYYDRNTVVSLALIEACVRAGVENFLFSSTAAVYGMPDTVPVTETAPTHPINPYGTSKLMVENMLRDISAAERLRFAVLRYFNVAGADPQGRTGQVSKDATHLIKVALQAALGQRPFVQIFGNDYDTADGTGVRDFIHVTDLADAHVAAVGHLLAGGDSLTVNCGYGRGYSVLEVLDMVDRCAGKKIDRRMAGRRNGDPACLVADPSRIGRILGWQPRHDDLEIIIRNALEWELRQASA